MIVWRIEREKLRKHANECERVNSCVFRTSQDHHIGKRAPTYGGKYDNKLKKKVETFAMDDSVYADDTAALFCSRTECEVGIPVLNNVIKRFGGEVHVKKPGQTKPSKSVYSSQCRRVSTRETTRMRVEQRRLVMQICQRYQQGVVVQ